MPRVARAVSQSGFYHVMVRGNGHQVIFEKTQDYQKMYDLLGDAITKYELELIAWCFMPNHIHLLLCDTKRQLSKAMQSLCTSYARYFNAQTDHDGHLFQNRFRSEPIETDQRLLDTVRYIHMNPQRAGICEADEYVWSSYHEYLQGALITSTELILGMLNGKEGLIEYTNKRETLEGNKPFIKAPKSNEELVEIAISALNGLHPSSIASLPKQSRNECLRMLKEIGLTGDQIARLTGIGKSTVYRVNSK